MKRTFQRILVVLAAVGFVGSAYVYDAQAGDDDLLLAQDDGTGGGGETGTGETGTGGTATELTADELNFVTIASYVSCYNERIPDVNEANAAIEYYLGELGMSLTDYQTKVTQYGSNQTVQDAITKEKEKCPTYVLPMPSGDVDVADDDDDDDATVVEVDPNAEPTLKLKGKKYKGSGGGFSIVVSMKKNDKGSASVTGGSGQSTSMGGSATRKDDKITFSVSSGKNSGSLKCEFGDKKVDEEENTYYWKELDCSFSGTVNGKSVSFSTTLKKN